MAPPPDSPPIIPAMICGPRAGHTEHPRYKTNQIDMISAPGISLNLSDKYRCRDYALVESPRCGLPAEVEISQVTDEANKETRRQTVPEDLRTSEIRYRRLFESARDGILILDAASRKITDANPFMVELMGYSRDEFLGRELWEIGLFKDKDESRAAFRELQEAGYIRYDDLPLQTKAGKQWNVEFISNVYREDGHEVIQCNIRDITERKNVEERLKQGEQWLRTIFEASHEGIVVEKNERIHYVNKSYLRLFGYDDPEELIGRHISVIISPEDVDRLLEYGRSRLRCERPPSEYEFKGRRKDGSSVDVEASVSASYVAGSHYITTMIRDIAERKRAEEALRESEARFRAAFEQANVGIVQASFEGRLLVVNPGFCRLLGYAEEEARGMKIRDLSHPDDYEKEEELTRRLVAGEIPGYVLEKRYFHKGGGVVWGQMTAALIRDASGEPSYMLSIVEDITGRKRGEELLRASEAQLRTLFDEAPVGVYLIDGDFRIRAVNRAALPVFGDFPDLIGRDFDEVIHVLWGREYADELVRLFRRTLETGEPYYAPERIEERRDRGVTEYYEWQINRIPLPAGGYGVVCYFRDISASVSARQKIAESEEKYRTLFESIDEGFCIIEVLFGGDEKPVDYRFLEVSPSFERQTGIANAAGRRMREIAPLHEEYWFEIYGEVARTGEPVRFEKCAEQLRRWYDGYAFRVGEPRLRRVGILFQDITERKRAEEALKGLNERLEQHVAERTAELTATNASLQAEIAERRRAERGRAQVLRRLVMAQEDERRRIAREMHDQFGQQLTTLLLKLGLLKEDCGGREELCEQVEALEAVARQLDSDVDFLVWALRPTALDDFGLEDALANYARNWSKHFGVPVEVHARGVGKGRLTSETETVLYRIAQEALNNVAKHARAANVSILLEHRADTVSLIVEDDGVGFDPDESSDANDEGLGLVGMRERAALVGGTAEVDARPGAGVTVYVRIPAPQEVEAHE